MAQHVLRTMDDILDLMFALGKSAVLKTALELNVADHLSSGTDTAAALAAAESADPRAVEVVLDACCGLGLTDKAGGRYRLAPIAEQLLPRSAPLGQYVPFFLDRRVWERWLELTEVVRQGMPLPRPDAPEFWVGHARATFGMAQLRGLAAVPLLDLPTDRPVKILDVGCGSGGLGYALALSNPNVRVTGVDREPVIRVAEANAAQLGLSERVTLRSLDIMDTGRLGDEEFDAAVLSGIFPGYGADQAQALLRKVWRALVRGGRILVGEPISDEERREATTALLFAAQMLLATPDGGTRTFSEHSRWLSAAGFENVEPARLGGYWDAVVARKTAHLTEPDG